MLTGAVPDVLRRFRLETVPVAALLAVLLLVVCHLGTLRGMASQWWTDEDMGHGFLVPLVIAWIIWRERAQWQTIPLCPDWWGLPILAGGAALHFAAALGVGLFAAALALLISVAGLIVFFAGWRRLRAWAFPLLLALFMLPKLAIVYNQATLPLQLLASRMAAGVLSAAGVGVLRQGNILDVGGRSILVAEACSGIRYLLPLAFMGLVIAYGSDARVWMRLVLVAAAVPVAIAANSVRVAVAAAVPGFESGSLHSAAGMAGFLVCLAALDVTRRIVSGMAARRRA